MSNKINTNFIGLFFMTEGGYLIGKPEFVGIEARALNKNDEHSGPMAKWGWASGSGGQVAQWHSGPSAPLLATALEVMA